MRLRHAPVSRKANRQRIPDATGWIHQRTLAANKVLLLGLPLDQNSLVRWVSTVSVLTHRYNYSDLSYP